MFRPRRQDERIVSPNGRDYISSMQFHPHRLFTLLIYQSCDIDGAVALEFGD